MQLIGRALVNMHEALSSIPSNTKQNMNEKQGLTRWGISGRRKGKDTEE
jgi:hypothetical protein